MSTQTLTTSSRQLLLVCLLMVLVLAGQTRAQADEKLYLFNWCQKMDREVIASCAPKYDVEVVGGFYGSNPELCSKLRAGGDHQYDVIFPSNYYVPRLIETGLIQPLDKELLPNYANLMARFADPDYDRGGKYTARSEERRVGKGWGWPCWPSRRTGEWSPGGTGGSG